MHPCRAFGSGKTTTLVARIAWLIATGVPPGCIAAITFNRRAADELRDRVRAALDWLPETAEPGMDADKVGNSRDPGPVRVQTFHALGLEILRSTGRAVGDLVDRVEVLREVAPWADPPARSRLDAAISRLKLELSIEPAQIEADPGAGRVARTYVAYEAALARRGAIDFDDLVRLALRALEDDPRLLATWRERCAHLLVDETQDVDRSQLRLALLLAAPANRIFLVGDDDQSIYGWRLADVRRVLGLAGQLAGLGRVDLEVNYRCPPAVLQRAVRLVERNAERFAKRIRAGPAGSGQLVLAPHAADDADRVRRVLGSWSSRPGTQAILARTNRELLPAAAVALELGLPFRAPGVRLLVEDLSATAVLAAAEARTDANLPLPVRLETVRARLAAEVLDTGDEEQPRPDELAAALLAWSLPYPDLASFREALARAREQVAVLRRDDANLTLATAHATKGLEFDHVAVIGMDAGRFPSARAVGEAEDPGRALEEERRLAYVAWTRARRSLTLVYDPANPSSFMLEAFEPDELGLADVG